LVDVIEFSGTDKTGNLAVDLSLHLEEAVGAEVIAPGAQQ
jgi:hypothetical protein